MRSLEYRSPRVHLPFSVEFDNECESFRGTGVDVSEKGVRARFTQHLAMDQVGSLVLHHPRCKMTIPARVVYLLKDQVGFAFLEQKSTDHELLRQFMTALKIR